MKTPIVLGSTCIMLAIGAVSYLRETNTRQELEDLKATVAEISKASSSSCTCPSSPSTNIIADLHALAGATAARENEAEAAPAKPSSPEPANSLAETREEAQELYRSAHAREAKDPTWSRESESRLNSLAQALFPEGSRLLSIDCRTTMCMMEIAHASEAAAKVQGLDGWMTKLLRDWGGGGVIAAGERQQGTETVQTLMPVSPAFHGKPL
jgi:hypothetical protein